MSIPSLFRKIWSLPMAWSEFGIAAKVLLPTMTNPKLKRSTKRKELSAMVNALTDDTFKHGVIAKQIMKIINMKEDVCKEYHSTDAQVQGILSWLPRMELHRDKLTKTVEKYRKEYGLTL